MREIKFRGYDLIDGMGEMITMHTTEGTASCIGKNNGFLTNIEDLMQFTGIHDKNGKEIYEGDIVQHINGNKGLVTFENASFCLSAYNYYHDSMSLDLLHHEYGDDINKYEIIGNIYEPQELLNKD